MELVPLTREQVGFDYSQALLEIRNKMSYDQIAEYCGYANRASIHAVIMGAIPLHPQGEAIWSLYCLIFGRKPPLVNQNKRAPLTRAVSSA